MWVTSSLSGTTPLLQTVAVRNEVCHVKFTTPRGPHYRHCGSDRLGRSGPDASAAAAGTASAAMCSEPLLPDPYEAQYCYVRASKLKGAQEGLFARRDMPAGSVVAFYNGVSEKTGFGFSFI